MTPAGFTYEGEQREARDFLLDNRANLVLKRGLLSAGGDNVVVGRFQDAPAWEGHVATALETGVWIVQEYIETRKVEYLDKEAGLVPHDLTWGLFAAGGECVGTYLRMMPTDRGGIVNAINGATESIAILV